MELDGGLVSLELQPDELASVLSSLRALGGFQRQQRATYDLVNAGGSELILTDDWDEPCLLSQDAAGTCILREVCDPSSASPYRAASSG